MQIHFLPLDAAFGEVKMAVSPVMAVHKAALHSQMLLYQAWHEEMEMKSTNRTKHRRLVSRKGGFWKNNSLSLSFGNCWASKVKLNAYYNTMKVLFDLACMSACCWGLPKAKYKPFITYNRGHFKPIHDFREKRTKKNTKRECQKRVFRDFTF